MTTTKETLGFQAEVKQLLQLDAAGDATSVDAVPDAGRRNSSSRHPPSSINAASSHYSYATSRHSSYALRPSSYALHPSSGTLFLCTCSTPKQLSLQRR